MLSDDQLIELMINEPSWEDVLYKIMAEEGMNPWDIDLVRLSEIFLNYLSRMDQLDLRVPARFILVTAILLRMKSDILAARKQREYAHGTKESDIELIKELSQVPPLEAPINRAPLGNPTIEELVIAMRKALEVQERRVIRKARIRRAVEKVLPENKQDITERISSLLDQINKAISDIEKSTTFSKLVSKWERAEIVGALMPMLHLSQDGKITYEQPEIFNEIFIHLKSDAAEGQKDIKPENTVNNDGNKQESAA
jgi:segregation and condensation protein A